MATVKREDIARDISATTGMTIKDVTNILRLYDDLEVECLRQGHSVKRGKNTMVSLKRRKARKRYIHLAKEIRFEPEKLVVEYSSLANMKNMENELNSKKYCNLFGFHLLYV